MSASVILGGSGYLGTLIAAGLLAASPRRLLLPLRPTSDPATCLASIRAALLERGVPGALADERLRLITTVELPTPDRLDELLPALRAHDAGEVIHAAGCLDYWDKRSLQAVNIELTRSLVRLATSAGLGRFIYISTAYCSGYLAGVVPERLHPDPSPSDEPTEYTRTKRGAEAIVAESGLAFALVRPSIVIGDSRTGHYAGKNYGLYQMWRAIEGLLTREYAPVWYTVAPHARCNFVHQDAFQDAFLALHGSTWERAIIHVVSDHAGSPTMRDLCWLWADVYRPAEIHCYPTVDDVPLRTIPNRQRRFLELAAKNLEISSQGWQFETAALDRLRSEGLAFADATLESVARCQQRYIERSARIQAYLQQLATRSPGTSRLIEL